MLVYDIAKSNTFQSVERWLKELKDHADNNIKIMLVGNKCDLKHLRQVPTREGTEFSEKNGISFIETSALDATNVDNAFTRIITTIYEQVSARPLDASAGGSFAPGPSQTITITPPTEPRTQKSKCC